MIRLLTVVEVSDTRNMRRTYSFFAASLVEGSEPLWLGLHSNNPLKVIPRHLVYSPHLPQEPQVRIIQVTPLECLALL